MKIKITKSGKFGHPDPIRTGHEVLAVFAGDVIEVDDEQGQHIVGTGYAELDEDHSREVEVVEPEIIEVPEEPEVEIVVEPSRRYKRGRKAGQKRT